MYSYSFVALYIFKLFKMIVVIGVFNGSPVGPADRKTLTVLHDVYIGFLLKNIVHVQQNTAVTVQKAPGASCQLIDISKGNPVAVLCAICHHEHSIIVIRENILYAVNRERNLLVAADKIQSPVYGGEPFADVRKNMEDPLFCKVLFIDIVKAVEACGLPDMLLTDRQKHH